MLLVQLSTSLAGTSAVALSGSGTIHAGCMSTSRPAGPVAVAAPTAAPSPVTWTQLRCPPRATAPPAATPSREKASPIASATRVDPATRGWKRTGFSMRRFVAHAGRKANTQAATAQAPFAPDSSSATTTSGQCHK